MRRNQPTTTKGTIAIGQLHIALNNSFRKKRKENYVEEKYIMRKYLHSIVAPAKKFKESHVTVNLLVFLLKSQCIFMYVQRTRNFCEIGVA